MTPEEEFRRQYELHYARRYGPGSLNAWLDSPWTAVALIVVFTIIVLNS